MSLLKTKFKNCSKLSPLLKSQEIQKITDEATHFLFDNHHEIIQDLYNEIGELKTELHQYEQHGNNLDRIFEELGDVLFVLGNLANRYNIDSEEALEHSIREFERRIIYCEEHCKNGEIKTASKEEIIKLWKEAKTTK